MKCECGVYYGGAHISPCKNGPTNEGSLPYEGVPMTYAIRLQIVYDLVRELKQQEPVAYSDRIATLYRMVEDGTG